jgi:hypothetical protein
MTPNLDELERLAKEATPGKRITYDLGLFDWPNSPFNPWRRILVVTEKPEGSPSTARFGEEIAGICRPESTGIAKKNAAYIAALDPQTVQALIARCREAEKDRECHIDTAPKDRALLGWFPSFNGHPARWWCMRYSFIQKEWCIQLPAVTDDGKQLDAYGIPQPTHWRHLPSPPAAISAKGAA